MRAFINIKRIFIFLYVMAITALLVLPSVKYSFTFMQTLIFSLPLVVLALIEGKTYRKVFAINVILLAITFISAYVFNFRGNISNVLNIVVSMYLYVLPLLICQYIIDLNDKVLMKWVTVATCLILVYILFVTFGALFEDPTIARHLAYGTIDDPYINAQRMRNVGGFGFCYCLCMLPPYLTSVIGRVRKKQKILVVLALIVLLVFAVYSQYTTFVLLAIGSIFYVLLTQGRMSIKKAFAIIILFTITLSFKQILLFLANNLGFSTLSAHFYSLYYILEGAEELNRWSIYKANLVLFFKNPIFGADLTVHYSKWLVDHAHSTFLSRMASGGLVGIGGFVGFIASAWYYFTKKSGMRHLIPVFITYIILSILNPVQPEISVTAFMLIPLIEYQFINRKEQYYV